MHDDVSSEVSGDDETRTTSAESAGAEFPRVARPALAGLLDELIARAGEVGPVPERLRGLLGRLTEHPAALGPEDLRTLTDAAAGRFGADDGDLVVALTVAAGLAIENALLHREARRRERWQAVSTRITGDLLGEDPAEGGATGASDPRWHRLLELAVDSAEAHGGAVCAVDPTDPDRVRVLAAVGTLRAWQHERVVRQGSITDAVLGADGPISFDDTGTDPRTPGAAGRAPGMRRAVATRLGGPDADPAMALVLSRQDGAAPFGPLECDMISGFAAHVATALALREARGERAAQRRAASSERLARHLNDEVMGRLMRLGLDLAGLASRVSPDAREQVLDHIDTLDHVTRTIRDTVFSLDVS